MNDNRRSHRVNFDCFVEFITSDCHHVCELVDISLQGAMTMRRAPLISLGILLSLLIFLSALGAGQLSQVPAESAGLSLALASSKPRHVRRLSPPTGFELKYAQRGRTIHGAAFVRSDRPRGSLPLVGRAAL